MAFVYIPYIIWGRARLTKDVLARGGFELAIFQHNDSLSPRSPALTNFY